MADSIFPWLSGYLISVGEEHGASLIGVPSCTKKKKIQIVEFLTFGAERNNVIWAILSDKDYRITARFREPAMTDYNLMSSKRLTELKSAAISVTNYRPFFARVPLGKGKPGMTREAVLALDIEKFTVLGSIGEAEWGFPKHLEDNDDLRLWCEGLRQDGGGGNILKDRKLGKSKLNSHILEVPVQRLKLDTLPAVKQTTLIQPAVENSRVRRSTPAVKIDYLKEYHKSWSAIADRYKFTGRPDHVKAKLDEIAGAADSKQNLLQTPPSKRRRVNGPSRHPLDLDSSQSHKQSPGRSQSLDSSHSSDDYGQSPERSLPGLEWSSSVPGTPSHLRSDDDNVDSSDTPESSPLAAPTPGQRPKPFNSPRSPVKQVLDVLSSTSINIFSSASTAEAPTLTRARPPENRKVPRPAPPSPLDHRPFGPERILVPCSDSSGTASQPFSQSQSQSLTQSHQLSQLIHSSGLPNLPEECNDQLERFPSTGPPVQTDLAPIAQQEDNGQDEQLPKKVDDHSNANQLSGMKQIATDISSSLGSSIQLSSDDGPKNFGSHEKKGDDEQATPNTVNDEGYEGDDQARSSKPPRTDLPAVVNSRNSEGFDEDDVQISRRIEHFHAARRGLKDAEASPKSQSHADLSRHPPSAGWPANSLSVESQASTTGMSALHIVHQADARPEQRATKGMPVDSSSPRPGNQYQVHEAEHDATAWSAPSFWTSAKGKEKATMTDSSKPRRASTSSRSMLRQVEHTSKKSRIGDRSGSLSATSRSTRAVLPDASASLGKHALKAKRHATPPDECDRIMKKHRFSPASRHHSAVSGKAEVNNASHSDNVPKLEGFVISYGDRKDTLSWKDLEMILLRAGKIRNEIKRRSP